MYTRTLYVQYVQQYLINIYVNLIYIYINTFKYLLYHYHTYLQASKHFLRIVTWNMGYLVLIVTCVVCINAYIATNSHGSDICYYYTKHADTMITGGVAYTELKTVSECQQQCNINETCLGVQFDIRTNCYLMFKDSDKSNTYPEKHTDYYYRHSCTASDTTAPICTDTFTVRNNTRGLNGQHYATRNTVELCAQICLWFSDTSKFCTGFDFNDYYHTCYLHWDVDVPTSPMQHIAHYTRQSCTLEGNYEYTYTLNSIHYNRIVIYTLP